MMGEPKPQRLEITHNEECWKYGQHHYECAVEHVGRIQAELDYYRMRSDDQAIQLSYYNDNTNPPWGKH